MIYQIEFYNCSDSSQGFEYFSNKADAVKKLRKHFDEFAEKEVWTWKDYIETYLSAKKTPTTKKQVLSMLAVWATHPDNG